VIEITDHISIHPSELKFSFMASPGPGGQNVNKVASGVLLRFDVLSSPSLPEGVRTRLIALLGKRLTNTGELIIKATSYRTQERNKQDAIERLQQMIKSIAIPPKKRRKTRPTLASKQRRLTSKKMQGNKKNLRRSGSGEY
jgi:ribosome-associated protein